MNFFKKALSISLLVSAIPAFSTTIVSVKGTRVIEESKRGVAIKSKIMKEEKRLTTPLRSLAEELQTKEASIIKKQKALNEKAQEFEKSSKMLSTEAKNREFESLQDEKRLIEEEANDLQRLGRKYNSEAQRIKERLDKLNEKEFESFNDEIKEVIQEVSSELGWDIVLMHESLVYSSAKVDKTNVIIERLDKLEEKRLKNKIEKDKKELMKDQKELADLKSKSNHAATAA